jgi:hypothetical protein
MHPEILQIIKDPEQILEPETLRQTHPDYSEVQINKILALATLYKTQAFFENFYLFEDITQALNGRVPNPKNLEGCVPEEMWYSLEIAHRLFPEHEFAKEIVLYVKYFMNNAGVYIFPPFLDIPNPYYSKAVYLSVHGPFPLGESVEEIQAARYLVIQEYIKNQTDLI